MPAIYLLRHGQASFGTDDYDVLSERGERQARVSALEIARRAPRTPFVTSGTLSRQRGTAAIAAEVLGVETAPVDPRWDEFSAHALVDAELGGPGTSDGLTSDAFQRHLDVALAAWIEGRTPGWREFSNGVLDALSDLAASLPKGMDAVVATSAGVTAAICGRLLAANAPGVIALNRVSINASITTIAAGSRGLSLISFNEHAHLLADRDLLTNR
ncbi:MAG: histidine phosphatase family protein [Actinobacteria bacterium]|nr:histidine phosphatase family protein [Actinomycetota bacterium]